MLASGITIFSWMCRICFGMFRYWYRKCDDSFLYQFLSFFLFSFYDSHPCSPNYLWVEYFQYITSLVRTMKRYMYHSLTFIFDVSYNIYVGSSNQSENILVRTLKVASTYVISLFVYLIIWLFLWWTWSSKLQLTHKIITSQKGVSLLHLNQYVLCIDSLLTYFQ